MARTHTAMVAVLEEDPDLGGALDAERFAHARRVARAPAEIHEAGPWSTRFDVSDPRALCLLILEGLIAVQITTEHRTNLELLGAGDVVRPWTELGPGSVPAEITWTAKTPTRVAFLDDRFARWSLAFPEIAAALMDRLVVRARGLSLQLAVNAVPRLTERLLLTLWHLADRWARVTPHGVALSLPLTHSDLSHLVAANRPSVSTAIGQLRDQGLISPLAGGGWLLSGEAPPQLHELRRQLALPAQR